MSNPADNFTIQPEDKKLRLQNYVLLVAGVDPTDPDTPRFLPVTGSGLKIDASLGGLSVPTWDAAVTTRYGSTNNIHTLVFKLGGTSGTVVSTLTFTYHGGGALDNDTVASIVQT